MNYERMKEIRTYFDNTQKELADYLNVSRSTYAGWENGIDAIPLLKLNDFCNYYKISLDYICGLSSTKKVDLVNDKIDKIVLGNNLKTLELKMVIIKIKHLLLSKLINQIIQNMN